MNISKQKRIALDVLHGLESIDPTCILAGGAPRDWFLEREASDLDFYVYYPKHLTYYYRTLQLSRALGISEDSITVKDGGSLPPNYRRNLSLECVAEFQYWDVKVQVMYMTEPTHRCVVDRFPFGICQAWWKGDDIHVTAEFYKSLNHRVLYLLNDLYNDEDGYIQKIMSKFPDYLYVGRE
jgi:hypothetical protein